SPCSPSSLRLSRLPRLYTLELACQIINNTAEHQPSAAPLLPLTTFQSSLSFDLPGLLGFRRAPRQANWNLGILLLSTENKGHSAVSCRLPVAGCLFVVAVASLLVAAMTVAPAPPRSGRDKAPGLFNAGIHYRNSRRRHKAIVCDGQIQTDLIG